MSGFEHLIEEYFQGETPPERKKEIRDQIRSRLPDGDEALLLRLGEAINSIEEENELREKLANLKKTSRKHPGFKQFIKIAAVIALLIVLTVMLYQQLYDRKTKTADDIFMTYYAPHPPDIFRGDNDRDLTDFFDHYLAGDYHMAIEVISTRPEMLNDTINMIYLGNCYLNTGNTTEAVNTFLKVSKNNKYANDAHWYLALSYLKMDQKEKAVEELKKLVAKQNKYRKIAAELMNRIN